MSYPTPIPWKSILQAGCAISLEVLTRRLHVRPNRMPSTPGRHSLNPGPRFCAEQAIKLAHSDLERADAEIARALALNDLAESFSGFSAVGERFLESRD